MSDHANDETHTDETGFELEAETGELRPERFGQRVEREDLGGLPEELPAWRLTEDEALLRSWRFPDAATAAAFAHFVATYGAAAGGSPVVRHYRHQVTVRLATPPAGGVTDGDVDRIRQFLHQLDPDLPEPLPVG